MLQSSTATLTPHRTHTVRTLTRRFDLTLAAPLSFGHALSMFLYHDQVTNSTARNKLRHHCNRHVSGRCCPYVTYQV